MYTTPNDYLEDMPTPDTGFVYALSNNLYDSVYHRALADSLAVTSRLSEYYLRNEDRSLSSEDHATLVSIRSTLDTLQTRLQSIIPIA